MKANMSRGTSQRPECHNGMQSQHACIMRHAVIPIWPIYMYDRLSDVAENWVQWRSYFQSGARVLEKVLCTFKGHLFLSISMAYSVISCKVWWKNNFGLNSLWESSASCAGVQGERILLTNDTKLNIWDPIVYIHYDGMMPATFIQP